MNSRNGSAKSKARTYLPPALPALKRAARDAVELARRTGTPAWVLVDGKIVDATKLQKRPPKKKRR
jgi:hypothetical protein